MPAYGAVLGTSNGHKGIQSGPGGTQPKRLMAGSTFAFDL